MADLGSAVSSELNVYKAPTATDPTQAVWTKPAHPDNQTTPTPALSGGLILLSPTGGIRG